MIGGRSSPYSAGTTPASLESATLRNATTHPPPAVSVVLPTYNRMEWLPAAVSSVLDQTFVDFELLVVDDGSTDGTNDWLLEFDDPRVRTIRLPHSGSVARVRNAGAAQAAGRLLCFLDSDDLWLPRKLEVQVAEAARNPEGWSYTRYEHVDELGYRIASRDGVWLGASGRIVPSLVRMEASVSIVTVLVPRKLFEALGGFDERPMIREDYEFLVRLAGKADASALSECLALVRDHASRSTRGLRGAEPFLVAARTFAALLESLEHEETRRLACGQRAASLAEAGAAHLRAGSIASAAGCLREAARSGASPRLCATAVRRGLGLDRKLVRRLVRPLAGRESRVWRRLPWPSLRHRCFGDPIDCVIHALLVSKPLVRFIQIGSNDGAINDPLWTFRSYANWNGVLVEPMDPAFGRLSRNYAPWKDRFVLVHAAVATETGPRRMYHFLESEALREDHDQLASLDPEHLERHSHRFKPGGAVVVASEVECLTFEDLLETHGVKAPDLLHVDAEGWDAAILGQVDLVHEPPAVLLYEHINLGAEERTELHARLEATGYETLEVGSDTLAVSAKAMNALPPLRAAWHLVADSSGTCTGERRPNIT